MLERLGCQ